MNSQVDTSGYVDVWVPPHGDRGGCVGPKRLAWHDLTPFAQGYVESLFAAGVWGLSCKHCAGNGEIVTDWDRYLGAPEPGDQGDEGDEGTEDCPDCDGQGSRSLGFSDLAPETLARIITDCERYASKFSPSPNISAGADFWRNRQRTAFHFVDGETCRSLKSMGFPPTTVQLGDDGKVGFA